MGQFSLISFLFIYLFHGLCNRPCASLDIIILTSNSNLYRILLLIDTAPSTLFLTTDRSHTGWTNQRHHIWEKLLTLIRTRILHLAHHRHHHFLHLSHIILSCQLILRRHGLLIISRHQRRWFHHTLRPQSILLLIRNLLV